MIRKNLNTPLWQLTVGEFIDMVESLHKEPQPVMLNQEQYVYGIAGIAKLFGCSKPTAHKIKSSGKIDKALVQTGRKIVVDSRLAVELMNKDN